MVESLANGNKMLAKKMDFGISSVLAFKWRSVAAVQGKTECQMDPSFVCLKVQNGGLP